MIVWLDPVARHQIESEAMRRRFVETGGPLFGFAGGEDLVVIGAGGPGPLARHRPRSFRPDHDAVDRAIARVQEMSERRYRYLGSWHTHPFGGSSPSHTDTSASRGISQEAAVLLERPLLIIQATWPARRTMRDRDLRAYRWSATLSGLEAVNLRLLALSDQRHPALDVDWSAVVQ